MIGEIDKNPDLASALDDRGAFLLAALVREGMIYVPNSLIEADGILQELGLPLQPSLSAQAQALQTACNKAGSVVEIPD